MRPDVRTRRGVRNWWPKVSLPDPLAALRTRRLLDEARDWFLDPECQRLLTAFSDQQGRPLKDSLALLSPSIEHYMGLLYFRDGSGSRLCAQGAFAVTSPGSRVVWICGWTLEQNYWLSPRHAIASVIHEVLHTLGLGENPPSSAEITTHVLRLCGQQS